MLTLKLWLLNKSSQLKYEKNSQSVTIMFDSVFFKSAIFVVLSVIWIILYVKKQNGLDSKLNSSQMKDCFEACGKQYWEKNLII